MKDSILLTKSKAFALRVVRLYKYLRERKESVIAKQMLRSGTSIGANIAESRFNYIGGTCVICEQSSYRQGTYFALYEAVRFCYITTRKEN